MVYLRSNGYVTTKRGVTTLTRNDAASGSLAADEELAPLAENIHKLVQAIFDPSILKEIAGNGHETKVKDNPLNENWKDFKELWERINKKYAYTVEFDSAELIEKSIAAINSELRVARLSYTLTKGEQIGTDFNVEHTETKKLDRAQGSFAEYDLIGKIAEGTTLTRRTVTAILSGILREKLWLFRENPRSLYQSCRNHQSSKSVGCGGTYYLSPSAEEPIHRTF